MFTKILIANRGEIACRIIESAQRLGVATVAVYSDADARAKHVAMADEAVHIGGPAPADSYLRGDVIIATALETGAQAIHPGYGFLSENPDFVAAVETAGLVFIGPSAQAIRAMGLKDAAKALMHRAGVPVVPGYHGSNQDDAHLAGAADAIGYPVLIKAVAGGGGKGMRLVEGADAFRQALDSARSEAKNAFGNSDVLVEKYIRKPRHIEVQIFGDGQRAVHLYERDCSLQRRHQKVMEEAPAPGMTPEMRAAMGAAAVQAAEAISYSGAGTVEFIVDASDGLRPDGFWFMEMNTRLQVEHPVTEAVTGIDLVEWQLRVAAGEPLPLTQDDITLRGHAFEARLYAEDVPAGFLPATGTLEHLAFAPGVRVDSGVRPGDVISPYYDPMIAKIVTQGPTRDIALARLRRALAKTRVAGCVTNLAFLSALTRHAGLVAGDVDTDLIGRDLAGLTQPQAPDTALLALAAIGVAGLMKPPAPEQGFALWQPLRHTVGFEVDGAVMTAGLQVRSPGHVLVGLGDLRYDCVRAAGGTWMVDGVKVGAEVVETREGVCVFGPQTVCVRAIDPLERDSSAAGDGNLIEAPMPGLVKAMFARPGQAVHKGDRLAILEAMKMEHALLAARDGVVAEVLVREGDQVEAGAALIRLEETT